MSLPPFLKPKQQSGVIVTTRKPDGSTEMEGEEDHGLMSCAEDLARALKTGDTSAVAQALRSAFEILDSEPHEEGPHVDEEEYSE